MLSGASANAAATLLLGAVELAGIGITLAENSYVTHQNEKYLQKVNLINALYDKHLAKIRIDGFTNDEFVSLAPIFVFESPKVAKSLQLNDALLKDLATTNIVYTNPHLITYGELIRDAIAYLREYYNDRLTRPWYRFAQGSNNDITSSVLTYLILMLKTHCLTFEGNAREIAYLSALTIFVNELASLKNFSAKLNSNNDRYQHLSKVRSKLLEARKLLKDQNANLSIEDLLAEFAPSCINIARSLLKCYTKLLIEKKHWPAIDCMTIDRLERGYIKPPYKFSQEISIVNSPFKVWLQRCAHDYQLSLPGFNTVIEFPIVNQKFQYNILTNFEFDEIKAYFLKQNNFLTVQSVYKNDSKNTKIFVSITDLSIMLERIVIFSDLLTIIDRVIACVYLGTHLWNTAKQLGELYLTAPNHLDFTFGILQGLGNQLKLLAEKLITGLEKIEQDNMYSMLPSNQENLALEIKQFLNSVRGKIFELISQLFDKHNNRVAQSAQKALIDAERNKLLQISTKFSLEYGIPTTHPIKTPSLEFMRRPSLSVHPEKNIIGSIIEQKEYKFPEEEPSNVIALPYEGEISVSNLDSILDQLHHRIENITHVERPNQKLSNTYQHLYKTLSIMRYHVSQMQNETGHYRHLKAKETARVAYHFCETVLDFLNLNLLDRQTNAAILAREISAELKDPKNFFMDIPKAGSSMATLLKTDGLFKRKTDTRKIAQSIANATGELRLALNQPNLSA